MKSIYIAFTILVLANTALFIHLYRKQKSSKELGGIIQKQKHGEVDEPDDFINFN